MVDARAGQFFGDVILAAASICRVEPVQHRWCFLRVRMDACYMYWAVHLQPCLPGHSMEETLGPVLKARLPLGCANEIHIFGRTAQDERVRPRTHLRLDSSAPCPGR